jgi:hypothetical protein
MLILYLFYSLGKTFFGVVIIDLTWTTLGTSYYNIHILYNARATHAAQVERGKDVYALLLCIA